ncbi:helix-turn-helix domain-containing protein [Cupriavidus sp. D39]|nr:helix-turn-helix domain-containing protein [Cupriavidus sp. D39]
MQATYFARAAGVARFAYNWALAEWKRQFNAHKAGSTQPIHRKPRCAAS